MGFTNAGVPSRLSRTRGGLQHFATCVMFALQSRQNGRDGVSNHQPHDCLLNRLFRHRSKKTFPFDDVIMFNIKCNVFKSILHIPALCNFDTSVLYPQWFRRIKFVIIPHVLYSSHINEIFLYNRQVIVITYELIYVVPASHRQGKIVMKQDYQRMGTFPKKSGSVLGNLFVCRRYSDEIEMISLKKVLLHRQSTLHTK